MYAVAGWMAGWWDIWCLVGRPAPLAWCSLRSAMGVGGFVRWLSGWLVFWFAPFCPVAPLVALWGGTGAAGGRPVLFAVGWGCCLLLLSGWWAGLLGHCCPSVCWVSCLLNPLALASKITFYVFFNYRNG